MTEVSNPSNQMPRLDGINKWMLFLAGVFILAGADLIVRPPEGHDIRGGDNRYGIEGQPIHISKEISRTSGITAVIMGLGICCLVLYRGRK